MRIDVRGAANAEEVAAVLAVLATAERTPAPDPYRRWRDGRLAAHRHGPRGPVPIETRRGR